MEKRGIYGRKSANVRLTCACLWRHFRQEKSFPVEGYKRLQTHTHTQTYTERHTHTDMHIHTHTHRSIRIKAVGIKYKDATNLQTLFSLKWATLFQLQSKDTIFLSNSVRFVLIITELQTLSTFLFFFIRFFFAEMERSTSYTQSSHFIYTLS